MRPKTGHSMMQNGRSVPQQRRKHYERRQIGTGIRRNTRPGAGRSVEHPGRNLEPTAASEPVRPRPMPIISPQPAIALPLNEGSALWPSIER